jgi:hypothetical protein
MVSVEKRLSASVDALDREISKLLPRSELQKRREIFNKMGGVRPVRPAPTSRLDKKKKKVDGRVAVRGLINISRLKKRDDRMT